MNYKQLARCTKRGGRNYQIVADIIHPKDGHFRVHQNGWPQGLPPPHQSRYEGQNRMAWVQRSSVTAGHWSQPRLLPDWQAHTAANGYWWPAMAKWAAKAARTASRINAVEV